MLTRSLRLPTMLASSPGLRPTHHSPRTCFAHPPRDSLEQPLTTFERQSWVAWQHHDGKFFASFLSDDHFEVGTNGIATKAQVVAFVASGACTVESYTVDHFHPTRFDHNTALLTYRAEQDTMCGQSAVPSPAWVRSLFVRRNGK